MLPTIITSLFGSILRVGRTFTLPMRALNGIAELKPVQGVNLLQEIPELSVPVVFFAGSYHYTTPFALAEQFSAALPSL